MSAEAKSAPTKLVRIVLSAITRVECAEVLEVPADITPGELEDLVNLRYRETNGDAFTPDWDYWERGDCHHERVPADENATPTGRVVRDGGELVVEELAVVQP